MARIHQNGGVLGKKRIYYDGNNTGVHDMQAVTDSFSGAPTNREGYNKGYGYLTSLYNMSFPWTVRTGAGASTPTSYTPYSEANMLSDYQNNDPTNYSSFISGGVYWQYTLGKQRWTVPASGTYEFTVRGAGGGGGGSYSQPNKRGRGAIVTFRIGLTVNDIIDFVVGHVGVSGNSTATCGGGAGGGGGGSFVYDFNASSLICAAGGGGGGGNDGATATTWQGDARINSTNGGTASGTSTVPGGAGGLGGLTATTSYGCVNGGGGGGGYSGSGTSGGATNQGQPGISFLAATNPCYGGNSAYRDGGFGGGGASGNYNGGGGGGYSGGAGGGLPTCYCNDLSGGGGGSCFVTSSATNVTQTVDTVYGNPGTIIVNLL